MQLDGFHLSSEAREIYGETIEIYPQPMEISYIYHIAMDTLL